MRALHHLIRHVPSHFHHFHHQYGNGGNGTTSTSFSSSGPVVAGIGHLVIGITLAIVGVSIGVAAIVTIGLFFFLRSVRRRVESAESYGRPGGFR